MLPGGDPAAAVLARRLGEDGTRRAQAMVAYWAGVQRERVGDEAGAISFYAEARRLDPGEAGLALRVAEHEADEGRWDEAVAILEGVSVAASTRPDGWLALSDFCVRHRGARADFGGRAVAAAREAVARFPGEAGVHVHAILTHLNLGEREAAAAALDQAMAREDTNPRYWIGLAAGARAASTGEDGSADTVLVVLRRAQGLAPNDPDVLGALADHLALQRAVEQAATLYGEMVALRPDDLRAREKLARSLALAKRQPEAVAAWQAVLQIDPQHEAAHRALAAHFGKTGDGAASVKHRAEALRWGRDESLREALALARDMLKAGLAADALPVLERAEFKAPHSPEPPYLAALAHQETGDIPRALAAFERAAATAADAAEAANSLSEGFFFDWALAAGLGGKIELAEAKFREAISRVPTDAPEQAAKSYNGLAYLWIDRGVRLDEAVPLVQRALKFDPENPAYLDTLGWCHFKKGEFAAALDTLTRAEAASERPVAEISDHRAQALWALDRRPEAIALLEEVVQRPDATAAMKQRLAEWRAAIPRTEGPGAQPMPFVQRTPWCFSDMGRTFLLFFDAQPEMGCPRWRILPICMKRFSREWFHPS
ncbi:MAG: tetratricopeptide repeat protein [Verrucomicrobiales bacterium]